MLFKKTRRVCFILTMTLFMSAMTSITGFADEIIKSNPRGVSVYASYNTDDYFDGVNLPLFTPIYNSEFEKWINRHIITKHTPHHNGYDEIWTTSENQVIRGKFQYGDIRKDLEKEWVSVYVYDINRGGNWKFIGREKTDTDGRMSVAVPNSMKLAQGEYVAKLYVEGDGTFINSYMKVVASNEKFVVFDIDGTLTKSDGEVTQEYIDEYFFEAYKAEAYEGAVDVVKYYKDRGYEIIYLTARPYWLSDISSKWLIDKGFPVGTLHTREEAVPSEGGDVYKTNYLNSVKSKNVEIEFTYGNAMTDIYAYKNIGTSLDKIYIIGENAGKEGTVAVDNYPNHLKMLLSK